MLDYSLLKRAFFVPLKQKEYIDMHTSDAQEYGKSYVEERPFSLSPNPSLVYQALRWDMSTLLHREKCPFEHDTYRCYDNVLHALRMSQE